MRHFSFDPATLTGDRLAEWQAWEAKAATAKGKLKRHYAPSEKPSFQADVWKELKLWYFKHVFYGKCAYCESETDNVSPGDGEHWRPKGKVTTLDDAEVTADDGTAHPGYYWLAYDWENLLPACEKCNRGAAKGTRFPVRASHAFTPDDAETVDELDAFEQPLLLHPFRGDDPLDHIEFNELGQPVARTEVGEASIRAFHLERETLNGKRRKRYKRLADPADQVVDDYFAARRLGVQVTMKELVERRIKDDDEFSLARRVYLWEHVRARIEEARASAAP